MEIIQSSETTNKLYTKNSANTRSNQPKCYYQLFVMCAISFFVVKKTMPSKFESCGKVFFTTKMLIAHIQRVDSSILAGSFLTSFVLAELLIVKTRTGNLTV